MKVFLVLFCLLSGFSAYAMGISCEIQNVSCNDKGDMYKCTYFGWAYGEFCSEEDVSRRLNGTKPEFHCADCYSMPKPNKQCQELCNCHSAFCGSW